MTDNTATDAADRKLDLIARLLAKAERTTPAEAEALTEHAERLMVKYGIEQAMLDERRGELGRPSEKIVEVRILFTGSYARDLRELGGSVGLALGTIRLLQANAVDGVALYLVGFESDVEQARILIASLEVQAMVALREWWSGRRAMYQGVAESVRRRARSSAIAPSRSRKRARAPISCSPADAAAWTRWSTISACARPASAHRLTR